MCGNSDLVGPSRSRPGLQGLAVLLEPRGMGAGVTKGWDTPCPGEARPGDICGTE